MNYNTSLALMIAIVLASFYGFLSFDSYQKNESYRECLKVMGAMIPPLNHETIIGICQEAR